VTPSPPIVEPIIEKTLLFFVKFFHQASAEIKMPPAG
jgi:hypothetical protein